LNLSDFDYDLPPDRIAQRPARRRDRSALMVLERGRVGHRRFDDIVDLVGPDDLLVLNDTRVLPARLLGRKPSGGRVEVLLLERIAVEAEPEQWRAWIRASRPPREGSTLELGPELRATVVGREGETWRLRLAAESGSVDEQIERHGRMPLPPYIRREEGPAPVDDRERYQTVYARRPGAVAAPTAGLHFTDGLLDRLRDRGVGVAALTLHVGLGTFQPVRVDRVERHRMHAEWMDLPQRTVEAVARTRRQGGSVIAVGTTVVRALESRATATGIPTAGAGLCDLFILPGFDFRVVDVMITNFHLPRSTLLMLVAAFAGRERLLDAYREAVARGYRFYSYGDAMWVRPS
jgi:S-adenosylmethionine:tRNA ribosyltransferase-isomerase